MTVTNDECAYINIVENFIVYLNRDDNHYYILDKTTGKSTVLR